MGVDVSCLVRLEPVRSAEPPAISGRNGAYALSARRDAWRVAILAPSALISAMALSACLHQPCGSLPAIRRANSAARSGYSALYAPNASFQLDSMAAPRSVAFRASAISGGISNGAGSQPRALRAAATSSSPSGAPWVDAVPCLFGAPKPMTVLQQIIVGRSVSAAARSIAAAIATG